MPARSVALGTRDRLDLIYLELARSKHGAMLRLMQGSRLPITTTAMGRALIAGMPETSATWLLGYIKRQEGKNWPKVKAGIERAIKDLRDARLHALARRLGARHQRGRRAADRARRLRHVRLQLRRAGVSTSRASGSKATSARAWSTWSAMSKSR